MKLFSTLPLIFLVASSGLAQRGGAPAGHASSGFSSGRSFSMAPSGYSRPTGSVSAYRPNLAAPARSLYSSPIGPPPFGGTQPIPGKRYPYPTNGYRSYYRGAYFYPGYLGYGGVYGYAGYPDDSSYGDQSQSSPAYQDVNAQAPPPDNGYDESYGQAPPPPRAAYQQQAPPPAAIPDQPETTLLFKDGRPPQQVQNYAVTSTTLYVLDGERRRAIPLDEIDVPQTEKTNRDAGLDFEIPAGAE
jgi:hypothetical protein